MSNVLESWSEIVPSVVKIPTNLYKYRKQIYYWWKRFLVEIDKGETNIIVTGRPSVGKSVLISTLYGEAKDFSWKLPDVSTQVETKAITLGDWAKIVRVIPGQDTTSAYKGLDEAFNQHNGLEGVIYVADWGYTSTRDKILQKSLVEEAGLDSLKAIRKFNLLQELKDFGQICTKIKEAHSCGRGPKWLLIAVNKADLFFNEINEAQKYYHPNLDSNFTRELNDLVKMVGSQNIKVAALPICAWETDFVWNNETVKTNIGGTQNRRALFTYLMSKISELSNSK